MKRNVGCNVIDHRMSRRGFLFGATAIAGLGPLTTPNLARQLAGKQKQILHTSCKQIFVPYFFHM